MTFVDTKFKERADRILSYASHEYTLPGGEQLIFDYQKYLWPVCMAKLSDSPTDEWAVRMIRSEGYEGRCNKTVLFHDEYWHFAGIGLVRLLLGFPQVFTAELRLKILKNALQDGWLREPAGTENHVLMMRSSSYLLAQEAEKEGIVGASERKLRDEKYLMSYAKRLFSVGQGEWDSSTYLAFDIISHLNIHDFADNLEMRDMASAVLDWYSASYAIKYTGGTYGGAEKRGAIAPAVTTIADIVGYLWFGDAEPAKWNGNVSNPIFAVHAAISQYRPRREVVNIARKHIKMPFHLRGSKPDYWMTHSNEAKETFYADARYSLGAVYDPIGGYAGGDAQIVTWKLVARGATGTFSMTGGGMDHGQKCHFSKGRGPWEQVGHFENTLIQLTLVPENVAHITGEVMQIFNEWKEDEKKKRAVVAVEWINPDPVNYSDPHDEPAGYVSFTSNCISLERQGIVFLDMEGTYAGIRSIAGNTKKISAGEHTVIKDSTEKGLMAGFVIEVGTSENQGGFAQFQEVILSQTSLTYLPGKQTVVYTNLYGKRILMEFVSSGSYIEPQFDWGEVPQFLEGSGSGRIPKLAVEGECIDLQNDWEVYESPYLGTDHGKLKVNDGISGFTIWFEDNQIREKLWVASEI